MISAPTIHHGRIDERWIAAADRCLAPDEHARAARFRQPAHRETWRAGRAWVRHHLAEALDVAPASIVFVTDDRGRPRVLGAPAAFDCNWSHSGPWMALAVSHHGPVGIDVEVVRSDFPIAEVEGTVCTPGERAALAALTDPTAKQRLFFRLWTAKEALMKATGLGAALDPARIDVRLQDGRPGAYATHPSWLIEEREAPAWVAAWAWAQPIGPPHGTEEET